MSDLDLDRGEARCVGRAGRPRVAPISLKAVAAIRAYLAGGRSEFLGNTPSDAVFLNPSGAALTRQAVWLMTRQHARAAGLDGDVTPHTLRHSRAAHMLDEGVDARRVQEWFGHANISTTQAYRSNRAVAVIPAPPEAP
jgi:integrase/recombinase XerD